MFQQLVSLVVGGILSALFYLLLTLDTDLTSHLMIAYFLFLVPGLEYPQESMEIPELQNTPELEDVTLESDDDGEDYPACAGGKN